MHRSRINPILQFTVAYSASQSRRMRVLWAGCDSADFKTRVCSNFSGVILCRVLKEQSACYLPVARQLLGPRSAECAVRQINVKRSEIDPVEEIEELEAEL